MSLDLTDDDKSTLVQVMAWCHQATSHHLSQCWPRSQSPYGITRPQWVNSLAPETCGSVFFYSFMNWYLGQLCEVGRRWVSQNPIDDKSTLVQMMAWFHREIQTQATTIPEGQNWTQVKNFFQGNIFVIWKCCLQCTPQTADHLSSPKCISNYRTWVHLCRMILINAVLYIPESPQYKTHQIPKLECLLSRLAVVFAQSIEAECQFDNEDIVGAVPTGYAPTTSEWSWI